MLSNEQIGFFEQNGYLVVEDVFDQKTILDPVRVEYAALLDRLYEGWHTEGLVTTPSNSLDFWEQATRRLSRRMRLFPAARHFPAR